jgi:hypothetical protein
MVVFPRYVQPGSIQANTVSVPYHSDEIVYRYWKNGKYGDVSCWFQGGILVLTDEPGFSLTFDDPSILLQGDYTISKHQIDDGKKHWNIERDVTHVRYLNANIVVPPTMGETELPKFTVSDRYGNTHFSGTVTVHRSQLTNVNEPLDVRKFLSVTIPFDPEYGNYMKVDFATITEWNRHYWAWLTYIAATPTLVDNLNHVYWLPGEQWRHGFNWLGSIPQGFDQRPTDSYVKEIQERFLTPLHNFGALISRARDGDNFMITDSHNVSNEALMQLTASKSSNINWLENAGDAVSFFKSIKHGKLKKTLKMVNSKKRELRRCLKRPEYAQRMAALSRTPILDPNGALSSHHKELVNELLGTLINDGLSPKEAEFVLSTGCLQGYKGKLANKGLEVLRGKDLTRKDVFKHASNSWLFYRYSVLTTKMDLDELSSGSYSRLIHETRKLAENEWQHVHSTSDAQIIQTATGEVHCTGKHSFQTWAKPYISNSVQQAFVDNQATGLITLANLWDIVPFSFVADWFFHVGDFLEKLDAKMGIDAAHYEFDVSIDSFTFERDSDVGRMRAYLRTVSKGQRTISLDADHSYSAKTGTWLKRFGDSVALLMGS